MKVITSDAADVPSPTKGSVDPPLSERLWCCPRCKFHRCFVTTEAGPSSTIQYEVMICDNCAHVEMRAAQLDVVAELAAGGEHGVRLVKFLPDSRGTAPGSELKAPLGEAGSETRHGVEAAGVVTSGSEVPPSTLRDFPPRSTTNVVDSLDRTAALLQTKIGRNQQKSEGTASQKMLTILLVISGFSMAAWLIFGREDPSAVAPPSVPSVSAATLVSLADLPGAPHAIDPGTIIDQARRASGLGSSAVLIQIESVFVGPNGKVDLDNPQYKGRIVFRFEAKKDALAPSPRPDGVPLGAPGISAVPMATYLLRAVMVTKDGIQIVEKKEWPMKQEQILAREILPHCSLQQIWEAARSGDAPSDAVATVQYTTNVDRPRWWFQIENTAFGFSFNPTTCTRY